MVNDETAGGRAIHEQNNDVLLYSIDVAVAGVQCISVHVAKLRR